jgi:hypothetical protein
MLLTCVKQPVSKPSKVNLSAARKATSVTDRARKLFYRVACGLAIIWLILGGLDLLIDLHRGRDIAGIEILVVVAIGSMIWLVGYVARNIR